MLDDLQQEAAVREAKLPEPLRNELEKPYRKPLPQHLPREDEVHQPACAKDCTCPSCGAAMKTLGEDVTEVLHGDDTPVPVLVPGAGKTKTGRVWTYVRDGRPHGSGDPPAAIYVYSADRRGEHPQAHLKDFRGVLHADGYAGFNAIFERGPVIEAACWAHVRRKFFDIHAANSAPIAKEALDRVAKLYAIEDSIRGLPPDERQRQRVEHSAPLITNLKA